MVDKTLQFILGEQEFRSLGCSRTDAMVSANSYIMQLTTVQEIETASFIDTFNRNLPPDIRVLSIQEASSSFNAIKSITEKEYIYLFACGGTFHPFAAPLMAFFPDNLDIPLMVSGAKLYEGEHDFINFCSGPSDSVKSIRSITHSEIVQNTEYSASFFPEKSYVYRVKSKGFMRNQVRLMMGQLIGLGKGQLTLDELSRSLTEKNSRPFRSIAPASGLILNDVRVRL